MLYLLESPIAITAGIATCIPPLLLGAYLLLKAINQSGRDRAISILGSLTGFFIFGGFLVGVVLENLLLPALPSISEQLPYYQASFVLIGVGSFFLLYWSVMMGVPDLFAKRKQLSIMPIMHIAAFVVLTLFFTTSANAMQISNGVESYIKMPLNVSVLAILWVIVYLGVAPLYSIGQQIKAKDIDETPKIEGFREMWLGSLLQLIGFLFEVIQFHDSMISIARILIATGWFWIFQGVRRSYL